ncbi:MAG: phosphatidylglycerophosphatase A, partial [Alphaproteobacteria bacterium]
MNRLPSGLRFTHPAALIATWFGSGLLPVMPGTWGSLAALPFAWVIASAAG